MCTLTWRRPSQGELEVFFNRDEKKSRPVADPPALRQLHDVEYLSPRDPLGGGTWMLANEHGIVVCLLNKWELEGRAIANSQSRGRLVSSMAAVKSLDEIGSFLRDLAAYPAFTLVAFSKSTERMWEWDGHDLMEGEPAMPLTSSSFQFLEVKIAREQSFQQMGSGQNYHAAAAQDPSPYTVRMNRPDAQTWSRSRLILGKELAWEYLAEQADLAGEPEKTVIVLPLHSPT